MTNVSVRALVAKASRDYRRRRRLDPTLPALRGDASRAEPVKRLRITLPTIDRRAVVYHFATE